MGKWCYYCNEHVLTTIIDFSAHFQRQELDRRRFEDAHLKYACLNLVSRYPLAFTFESVEVEADLMSTIEKMTPLLFKTFEAKYAG